MCSLTIECVLLLQVESQTMVLWLVITEVSGCPFLTRALGPIINNILNSRESFELDPREVCMRMRERERERGAYHQQHSQFPWILRAGPQRGRLSEKYPLQCLSIVTVLGLWLFRICGIHTFSKVPSTVPFYSDCTRALTFQKVQNPDSLETAAGNVQAAIKAICDSLNAQVIL